MSKEKNILVISDNPSLTIFLKNELASIDESERPHADYRYSSANKAPKSMQEIGAIEINLKEMDQIQKAIDKYDLIFSLHCKQIFPANLVKSVTCINFHPGLNPFNRGWYPQAFSIINGKPAGATIHMMDEEVDHGAIIDQIPINIATTDTSLEAYEKIITAEKYLIQKNIKNIVLGRYTTTPPESDGNYNSLADYKKLCEIDLKATGTFESFINTLRATTHGNFKNAFFLDENGEKIYVTISLKRE